MVTSWPKALPTNVDKIRCLLATFCNIACRASRWFGCSEPFASQSPGATALTLFTTFNAIQVTHGNCPLSQTLLINASRPLAQASLMLADASCPLASAPMAVDAIHVQYMNRSSFRSRSKRFRTLVKTSAKFHFVSSLAIWTVPAATASLFRWYAIE